jgi:hypothetical protein
LIKITVNLPKIRLILIKITLNPPKIRLILFKIKLALLTVRVAEAAFGRSPPAKGRILPVIKRTLLVV